MRIIFSRKGFDSTAGGGPSPIIDGRPVSLPIPADGRSRTRYADLGLGEIVEAASRGRVLGEHLCHDDPMFADGYCWFGQCGAAQGHLARHGVGTGDVFLFFGLYVDSTGERHHRIYGSMEIAACGAPDDVRRHSGWKEPARDHPHLSGEWRRNNTIYHGPGKTASRASQALLLTRPGGPLNRWRVPGWLRELGLSYHGAPARWEVPGELDSVKRGQEFVCDIGDSDEPRRWLADIVAALD